MYRYLSNDDAGLLNGFAPVLIEQPPETSAIDRKKKELHSFYTVDT
jgi:hypothetical protein